MKYLDEIKKAMAFLAKDKRTIFIGQSVEYEGTGFYDSVIHIDKSKKIEMPVAEYLQCGIANGMAIEGLIPVSLFSRWNFFLLGSDQIINHLDKFILMSNYKCRPKVIIRVSVGSESPIDPQEQHKGNFSDMFRNICKTIEIIELNESEDIMPAYIKALKREDGRSTILVEFMDYCRNK